MASSSTAIPDGNPAAEGRGEEEPLLGRPGDASQEEGKGLPFNFVIGTGVVAQAGIWILVALVWAGVFLHPLIVFSAHPLLNSAGVLLVTQGILVLQPTHTAQQKRQGTVVHSVLNAFGVDLLIAGLVVIEYTKISHGGIHFESPHAILGLITYALFIVQALVGLAQYYTPAVLGGVGNAKKLYKYHRASGYVLLVLALATVAAATQTDYSKTTLHIQLWAVLVAGVLVLAGVLPRIKKQKLGL
ncbi:MAG: hypothetical protein M1832_000440 [Thelocarpon impressellum]|nr:MAG: hypothetical protein M1832_000440 [Thelocarpon impressellum]